MPPLPAFAPAPAIALVIEPPAPDVAERVYLRFAAGLREAGMVDVQTGEFGAEMLVELVNDGPFTIWLDSER